MLDQRVCTHFSGCWVPEVLDTKKYQNKRQEQQAEEQSTELVPGAALPPRLGCFCLFNDTAAVGRVCSGLPGGGGHAPVRPCRDEGGKASHELTCRKRQSSGLCRAVPPMVSSVCEEPACSEVELLSFSACSCAGKAGPPPWRPASFPTVLLAHAAGHVPTVDTGAPRCRGCRTRPGPRSCLGSAPALHFCPCANGWRCPECCSL